MGFLEGLKAIGRLIEKVDGIIPAGCQTELVIKNHLDVPLVRSGTWVDAGNILEDPETGKKFNPPSEIGPKQGTIIFVDSTGGSSQLSVEYGVAAEKKEKAPRYMLNFYGYNPKLDSDFYGGLWGRDIRKNKQGVFVAKPISFARWEEANRSYGENSGNEVCKRVCQGDDGPSGEGPWWEKQVSSASNVNYHMFDQGVVGVVGMSGAIRRDDGSRLVLTFEIGQRV